MTIALTVKLEEGVGFCDDPTNGRVSLNEISAAETAEIGSRYSLRRFQGLCTLVRTLKTEWLDALGACRSHGLDRNTCWLIQSHDAATEQVTILRYGPRHDECARNHPPGTLVSVSLFHQVPGRSVPCVRLLCPTSIKHYLPNSMDIIFFWCIIGKSTPFLFRHTVA